MVALPYSDKITFNNVDINPTIKEKKLIRSWIKATVQAEKKSCGTIDFNFCSDEELLRINRDHLQHDYYTDIITFDFNDQETISGDIYISIDRIKDNAKTHQTTYTSELRRVLVHGVLHLCGYKDKSKKDAALMREKEDHYLSLFP